ncbi:MAG TPA: thymidylate kinase [bacterium]|nr:thymidylate kinase [bacterium]
MKTKRFYGKGLPNIDPTQLKGTLIVLEGSDGSGRSTQIGLLQNWLERRGYPTVVVGLKRSDLVGEALAEAMRGNTLNAITLNLFYATDFADQLERVMIPALKAGFVVLADRYIYTLMARDIVRGSSLEWLKEIYGIALVPDAVFYLNVNPRTLAERNFRKRGYLDYWESGMDIQRVGGMYDNFIKYQAKLHRIFEHLQKEFAFSTIHGGKSVRSVFKEIRTRVEKILAASAAAEKAAPAPEPPPAPEAAPPAKGEDAPAK